MSVRRVIADHAGLQELDLAVDDRGRREEAAMDQRDVGARQPGAREGLVEVAQEAVDAVGRHDRRIGIAGVRLVAGAGDRRAVAPRRREEQAAARHAADRDVETQGFRGDHVQAQRDHRHEGRQRSAHELRHQAIGVRPGGVHHEPRADLEGAAAGRAVRLGRDVGDGETAHAAALHDRAIGPDVRRDQRALRRGRLGERERHAIAVEHLAVKPGDATGHARRIGERIEGEVGVASEDPRAPEVQMRREPLVAVPRQGVVGAEVRGVGEPVAGEGAERRRHERQRPHEVWRDPHQGPPLADVLAQLADPQPLQAADAAVQRLGVVERGAAAEIAAIDQRDPQPAQRGIPGDGGAVDPGADHDHVERLAQSLEVALHAAYPNIEVMADPTPPAPADALHDPARTIVVGTPLDRARAAVILLHGRGGSADDIASLARVLAADRVSFLVPEATGHTWYPQRFIAPLEANEPWLGSALGVVGALVARVAAAGIATTQTAVAGFSQGACLALEFAARRPTRYGAVMGFSGGLIGAPGTPRPPVPPGASFAGTPIFLGCGDRDGHIPIEVVETSASVLEALGAAVDLRVYAGMGHTINEDEIAAGRALVAGLL